jgi:two-component system response regulator DevR
MEQTVLWQIPGETLRPSTLRRGSSLDIGGEEVQGRTSAGSDLRIVLFTSRPSVGTFFASLDRRSVSVSATTFDASPEAVTPAARAVTAASVAVVDASVDPAEALEVCRRIRALHAQLRTGVLFCCPHAASSSSLRPFLEAGVGSFLDLQLSAAQTLAALRAIARGEDVVRLHLNEASSTALFGNQPNGEDLSDEDLTLLRLVARGMTDHEIGAEMCLSHHTIKHRIERLRRRQHARNRIQLAALAARLESMRHVSLS